MDVLELPRPVINFLRTMAKEGCRYVLSWDIFGGTDTVTLTLTWKLNNDESQVSISKSPQQQIYDELHNDSISSPRRSRRDENTFSSAIFRSSRGKSLEENKSILNKQIIYHQQQISSLERSSTINRQNEKSIPIYATVHNTKYTTSPSLSSPLKTNPLLSVAHTNYRRVKEQYDTPIHRKVIPPIITNTPSKLMPINSHNDDTPGPWVKRLHENNTNKIIEQTTEEIDETEITSGKVKFKTKPDYF